MSTSDDSDNHSDWSAVESEHASEESLEEQRRYNDLSILYEEAIEALATKEDQIQKKNYANWKLLKENKEFRTIRDNKLLCRKRNHRFKMNKMRDACALGKKAKDSEDFAVFELLIGVVFGVFFTLYFTEVPNEINKNPWMKAEWHAMDTQHWSWKSATSRLFHKILDMESSSERRNLTKEVRYLEDVYWNVSKNLRDCSEQGIQTIEFHLEGKTIEEQAKGNKQAEESKEKEPVKKGEVTERSKEVSSTKEKKPVRKEKVVDRNKEAASRKEKSEGPSGNGKNRARSICDKPELTETVKKAAASKNGYLMKEKEIERQAEEKFGGEFYAWYRLKGNDVVVKISYLGFNGDSCYRNIRYRRDD